MKKMLWIIAALGLLAVPAMAVGEEVPLSLTIEKYCALDIEKPALAIVLTGGASSGSDSSTYTYSNNFNAGGRIGGSIGIPYQAPGDWVWDCDSATAGTQVQKSVPKGSGSDTLTVYVSGVSLTDGNGTWSEYGWAYLSIWEP